LRRRISSVCHSASISSSMSCSNSFSSAGVGRV